MTAKIWILIAKIAAIVLMVAAIVIMAICLKKQGDEKRRLKENFDIEVKKELSKQQTVSVGELKEYFRKEVETLKQYGIRPKDIESIVEVSYFYHDTTVYRDTLIYIYDTVRSVKTADFCVQTDCFSVEGQITGDTLELRDVKSRDTLLLGLYKEKRKCLFDKRRIKAIAVSGCSGDTLAILRNLKIEK